MHPFIHRMAAAALAIAAASALAQEPPLYRVRDLNALTGMDDISVSALNNRGDFAFTDLASGSSYLWRRGSLHDLGTVGAGELVLNERGDVAGTQVRDGRRVPFVWRNGSVTNLADALGAASGEASGINARGQVVGVADQRAFVFDGRHARFLDVPGATTSAAAGINDNGLIVGSAVFAGDSLDARAFTLRGGRFDKMPEPIVFEFGGRYGALAVNNAGNALVGYSDYNWGEPGTAMYVNGRIFDLGWRAFAHDINNHDWAAGTFVAEVNEDEFVAIAQLYHDGQDFTFDRLLTAGAAARWEHMNNLNAINDRGQVVGRGTRADGSIGAFIATPVPEAPAALTLLAGLGTLGAALRPRRRKESTATPAAAI